MAIKTARNDKMPPANVAFENDDASTRPHGHGYNVFTKWLQLGYGGRLAMIKKLTKHGNSWALVIDKPVLDLLSIDPETPLQITTDGQVLVIAPSKDAKRQAKFKQALQETNRRYGRALKRLAE